MGCATSRSLINPESIQKDSPIKSEQIKQQIQQKKPLKIQVEQIKIEKQIKSFSHIGRKIQSTKFNYQEQKIIKGQSLCLLEQKQLNKLLHRSIASITNVSKQNYFIGSGVLVSKNMLLTAAHNIYNKRQKREFKKQDGKIFCNILNGKGNKYYRIQDWRYPLEFKDCPNNQSIFYDYALIKIKEFIDQEQFLQLSCICQCMIQQKLKNINISIYGYPAYLNNYQKNYDQLDSIILQQYGLTKMNCIQKVQGKKLSHLVSTAGGQSGCPIVINERKIIAIHNGADEKEQNNIGRSITKDLIDMITKWQIQMKGNLLNINTQKCKVCILKQADKLRQTANYHFETKNYSEAINNYNIWLRDFKNLKGQSQQLQKVYSNIGHSYQNQQNYIIALTHLKQSLKIHQKLQGKQNLQTAILYRQIGDLYTKQDNHESSYQYYSKSMHLFDKLHNELHKGSKMFLYNGDMKNALDYQFKNLEIYQKQNDKSNIDSAKSLLSISKIYFKFNKIYETFQYANKAIQIYQKNKIVNFKYCQALVIIGSNYLKQKIRHRALQYYFKGIQNIQRVEGKKGLNYAIIQTNIGLAYLHEKNIDEAQLHQILAYDIFKGYELDVKRKQFRFKLQNLKLLGYVKFERRNYIEAQQYFKKLLQLLLKFKIDNEILTCARLLAQTYIQLGKMQQAQLLVTAYNIDLSRPIRL